MLKKLERGRKKHNIASAETDSHGRDEVLRNQQHIGYILTNYDDRISLKGGPTISTPKQSCYSFQKIRSSIYSFK